MDKEYLKFCYLIIAFFSGKSAPDTAAELLACLRCEMLLRDSNEIIYRILIKEAECRKLNLIEYLSLIYNNIAPNLDTISVPILENSFSDDLD